MAERANPGRRSVPVISVMDLPDKPGWKRIILSPGVSQIDLGWQGIEILIRQLGGRAGDG